MIVPDGVIAVLKWGAGIVSTLLLIIFGFHFNEVHNMSDLLSETIVLQKEGNVVQREMAKRVDRIAAALPDMGRFVAREELNKPIDSFLVTTRPVQVDDSWFMFAFHADSIEGQQQIYKILLANENDIDPAFSLAEAVRRLTGDQRSFAEMAAWSADVDEPAVLQSIFDASSSFVFQGGDNAALLEYLEGRAGSPETVTITDWPFSWPAVLEYTNNQVVNALYVEPGEW